MHRVNVYVECIIELIFQFSQLCLNPFLVRSLLCYVKSVAIDAAVRRRSTLKWILGNYVRLLSIFFGFCVIALSLFAIRTIFFNAIDDLFMISRQFEIRNHKEVPASRTSPSCGTAYTQLGFTSLSTAQTAVV